MKLGVLSYDKAKNIYKYTITEARSVFCVRNVHILQVDRKMKM